MKKEFKRDINSLEDIFLFIKSFIKEQELNPDLLSPFNLVVEEIFTNMVKYNPDNPNRIRLQLDKDKDQVSIVLTDFDAERFDIRLAKEYDTKQILEKRPIGKIGLHLVKKYMDDIDYQYRNRTSKITLIKFLGKKNV